MTSPEIHALPQGEQFVRQLPDGPYLEQAMVVSSGEHVFKPADFERLEAAGQHFLKPVATDQLREERSAFRLALTPPQRRSGHHSLVCYRPRTE